MCNINIMFGKNLKRRDLIAFYYLMVWGGSNNGDAFGVFNQEKIIMKRKGKINNLNKKDRERLLSCLENSWLVCGHNRLKTQGTKNHPFKTKDIVLCHNGIISNDEKLRKKYRFKYPKGETDSLAIIHLIQHWLDKGKSIKTAIKKTAEELEGSFSVFLTYKREGYYFKNGSTCMTCWLYKLKNKERIIMTTEEIQNFVYTDQYNAFFQKPLYYKKVEGVVEDNTIYRIGKEGVEILGSFKDCEPQQETTTQTNLLFFQEWLKEIEATTGEVNYTVNFKGGEIIIFPNSVEQKRVITELFGVEGIDYKITKNKNIKTDISEVLRDNITGCY